MKRFVYFIFALVVCMGVVTFSSCSSSSDDDVPSISFTESNLIGTWKVTSISGDVAGHKWLDKGAILSFYAGGKCTTEFVMEDSYKISGGKVMTYYGETGEPMFVYTLQNLSGSIASVKMNGTLDDKLSVVLIMEKQQ